MKGVEIKGEIQKFNVTKERNEILRTRRKIKKIIKRVIKKRAQEERESKEKNYEIIANSGGEVTEKNISKYRESVKKKKEMKKVEGLRTFQKRKQHQKYMVWFGLFV